MDSPYATITVNFENKNIKEMIITNWEFIKISFMEESEKLNYLRLKVFTGTIKYSDGSRYEGEFSNGLRNGKGTFQEVGGRILKG